jgi:hypothetical protein
MTTSWPATRAATTCSDHVQGWQGRDRLEGGSGNDSISAADDGARDQVKCGTGTDEASVDLNDVVDGELVSSVVGAPGQVISILSCEKVNVGLLN